MSIKRITVPTVAESKDDGYSNCLVVDDQIYLSGMIAMDERGEPIGGGDIYLQGKACMERCRSLLEAAGASLEDVLKLTVYLTDMSMRNGWNRLRDEYFRAPRPCSTLIEVKGLARPGMLIEIDIAAVRRSRRRVAGTEL